MKRFASKHGLGAALILATASVLVNAVPANACSVFTAGAKLGAGLSLPTSAPQSPDLADAPGATESNEASHSIVGFWDVKAYFQGQVIGEGLSQFHADGTEILSLEANPIEGNVCMGTWEEAGPSTYKLKHIGWFYDASGNVLGIAVQKITITLCADGNSFVSLGSEDDYDTHGNLIGHYTGGEAKGTRITVRGTVPY